MEMTVRIESLRKKVEELRYDAYLVTDAMNVRYLTGIPEPQSPYLLIQHDGDHVLYVLSDGLRASELFVGNECEIKASDFGAVIGTVEAPSLGLLLADLPEMDLGLVGFDTLSAADYLRLTEKTKNTTFISDRGTIWALRMIKSKEEILNIRKAAEIGEEAHKMAAEVIKPGMREYEVAAEVEYAMRSLGSEDEGHRTVVTSGPRTILGVVGGRTTDRKINKDELVIVDTGATINGYRSDLGRPYVAGKPTSKQKELYTLVRKAWDAAFALVKPGTIAGEVDAAARKAFGEYEKYCIHEVGHGIGLTSEPPALTKNSNHVLKENMAVNVEPALYIDGFGGFIIEDMTLVGKDGAERLTAIPMDWD